MGYFTNKKNGTANSVAGKLTNIVKEGMNKERSDYDNVINFNVPILKQAYREDEKFSGNGVEAIFEMVSDEYDQYNLKYNHKIQEIASERKLLFNPE